MPRPAVRPAARAAALVAVLAITLACGGAPAPAPPAAAPVPPAVNIPDPLAGRTLEEVCSDPTLAMIRWDFDALHSGYASLCCGVPGGLPAGEGGCELDWPFSDLPSCKAYDELRNGIFAHYGYPFQNFEWKARFEGKPGYVRRDDFDTNWLSPAAGRNVEKLKQLAAARSGCLD